MANTSGKSPDNGQQQQGSTGIGDAGFGDDLPPRGRHEDDEGRGMPANPPKKGGPSTSGTRPKPKDPFISML